MANYIGLTLKNTLSPLYILTTAQSQLVAAIGTGPAKGDTVIFFRNGFFLNVEEDATTVLAAMGLPAPP